MQLLLGLGGSSQGVGAFCLARPLVEIGSLTVFDRVAREPYVVVGVLDALFVVCVQIHEQLIYLIYYLIDSCVLLVNLVYEENRIQSLLQ